MPATIRSVTRMAVRRKLIPFFVKSLQDDSFQVRKEKLNVIKYWLKGFEQEDLPALQTLSMDIMKEMERRVKVMRDLIENEIFFREKE